MRKFKWKNIIKKALSSKGALKKLTGSDDIDDLKGFWNLMDDEEKKHCKWMAKGMGMRNPKAHYIIAFQYHNSKMAIATAKRLKGRMKAKFDSKFRKKMKHIDKATQKLAKKIEKGVKEDE